MATGAPSTQLDERVAQHVLGWRREADGWREPATGQRVELRPFSRDIAAAWEIADAICDRGFRLQVDGSRIWQARFYKSASHTLETKAFSATDKTPAEAICRAALAVLGVGEKG
jgi:hypothetical protein